MEGRRELGRAAIRAYWTRQFGIIDGHVEPESFEVDEVGLVVVGVHQVVRDLTGEIVSDSRVQHVYTLREGLIERMDVRQP